MVFDNGRYHSADFDGTPTLWPPDHSRVVEINPKTNKIEWSYRAKNPVDFYSTYISSNQRLPNGNTLICEGATGRIFEVTKGCDVVWQYNSPFYGETDTQYGFTSAIFRAYRYGIDHPGLKGKVFDDAKNDQLNRLYGYKAMKAANEI